MIKKRKTAFKLASFFIGLFLMVVMTALGLYAGLARVLNGTKLAAAISDSTDEIYEITGVSISNEEIDRLSAYLSGQDSDILDLVDEAETIDASSIRAASGGKYVIFFSISMFILIGMLALIDYTDYKQYLLIDVGIPAILAGLLGNIIALGIPELISSMQTEDNGLVLGVLTAITDYVTSNITFYANFMIVIGALLVGIFFALLFADKRARE